MLTMYPAARYCKDGRMIIVRDEAEAEALGKDWAVTPAAWDGSASVSPSSSPSPSEEIPKPPPVKRKPGRPRKV